VTDAYRPIADYGFLSSCRSSALVSSAGSVDWACLPRFDAGSAFGRLLDAERGGHFSIRPVDRLSSVERTYLDGSLVLETRWTTPTGTVRCTDALAIDEDPTTEPLPHLLRRVECTEGAVELEVVVVPRFDYGSTRPWLRTHEGGRVSAVGGNDSVVVHSTVELELDQAGCRCLATTTLGEGDVMAVDLVAMPAHRTDPSAADAATVADRLEATLGWWRDWSARTRPGDEHGEVVRRSAVVLKGLTCAPTGAVIAAPTTSLPEVPGGSSNWDYRYSWVRDAHVTLRSLAAVGHTESARGFRDFIVRSAAGHAEELQVMFGPYGERQLPERELDLEGWDGASPVRVGNGAATQTQLDVYGHLLDAVHMWHCEGDPIDEDEWAFLTSVVDLAANRWRDRGSGVWELRGPPREFVHSKVMVWVALDRALSLVDDHGFEAVTADRWRDVREAVRHDVETRGVDPDRGNFVQYYGTTALDASLLKLPLVGFVDATDERMVATTDAIRHELAVPPDGFLLRFRKEGSGGGEGVFLLCSCWLVEVLALQGRIEEAEDLLGRLVAVGNDLGLYSEEWEPESRQMLGNFPQAFTHLGLIAAARRLDAVRRGDDR
jgi:GH15 family glucan-1,4-alpha-glucosidase